MDRVRINNLGIPPLAGICSYEDGCKEGYDIEHNVGLLKRYNYVKKKLVDVFASHIARTPEWEVKCAFSLHMWLEAEHCTNLRKRVSEMREPPLGLDKVPDVALEQLMEELIRSESTVELLTAIYSVLKPAMIASLSKHINETNPIADYPTYRMLKHMLQEEEEMEAWGRQATAAIIQAENGLAESQRWEANLRRFLNQAGGIHGDKKEQELAEELKRIQRSDGQVYAMDPVPRRDHRFQDNFNRSALIDEYYRDDSLEYDERVYALFYKRLREMDVPEWMGPLIYKTKGKPWEYYHDLSRQLWDEARHAILGEIGLYSCGMEFYQYPVDLKSSMSLNTLHEPIEAHIILWAIEQGLMNKDFGKRKEWIIAKESDIPISTLIQDYDWADEVLHAQIGRKWLLSEFGSMEELNQRAAVAMAKWSQSIELMPESTGDQAWWQAFVQDIRSRRCCISFAYGKKN